MARCKATDLVPTMLDCPPPYTRYEVDEHRPAGHVTSPPSCHDGLAAFDSPHFSHTTHRSTSPRSLVHNKKNENKKKRLCPALRQPEVRRSTRRDTSKTVKGHFCSYCFGGAFAIVLCTLVAVAFFPYPLRASCTVQWGFDEPCKFVMQRLRCQIMKWTSCSDCGHRGNRCLYSLKESKSRENSTIRATHLSPNLMLIDDIRIEFEEARNNSCIAMAKSGSRTWYVMFDYGTNYCNLRNLVDGAGLVNDQGFMELTNDAVCTQLGTAICA